MSNDQAGVGLVEVLVALFLLGIVVLGFSALQMRAIAASYEAGRNIQAMNLARDLSERIRINRNGLLDYKKNTNTKDCANEFCTSKEMAEYDYRKIDGKAKDYGMELSMNNCQGSADLKRKCIYIAWEGTTATDGSGSSCTNGTVYLPDAKCIIVEVYNYD